jgi:hypothetical protein
MIFDRAVASWPPTVEELYGKICHLPDSKCRTRPFDYLRCGLLFKAVHPIFFPVLTLPGLAEIVAGVDV